MNVRRTAATVLAAAAVTILGTGVAAAATPTGPAPVPAATSVATSAAATDQPFQLTNNSNLQLVVTRMAGSCTNACPGVGYAIKPGDTQTWVLPHGSNSVSLDFQAKTRNSNVGGTSRVVFRYINDFVATNANAGAGSGLRVTTTTTSVTYTS